MRSDPDRFSFIDTDPVDSLRKLSIPGLWLYGSRDVSVPVGMSIERLEALTASGKPFKYVVFPGSGHELHHFSRHSPASTEWLRKSVVP